MENKREWRILIVDDEPANIQELSKILTPNYDVVIAKSGEAALAAAHKHMPDLILLDIIMPDMSGFDVIVKLKESSATSHIPVIFITGLDSAENEEMGFHLGAVDYIAKPFKGAIVRARVKTHLQIVEHVNMIERLCKVDALTNIANRRYFDAQFVKEWERACREGIPLAIILIDIDHFKLYNDTYGHSQGDALLETMARIFDGLLNRSSDFTARFGGDEFVILLPNTDMEGALSVAERVRTEVEKTKIPTADGKNTKMTVSLGVHSEIPDLGKEMSDFFNKADMAMYEAKKAGRNHVRVTSL